MHGCYDQASSSWSLWSAALKMEYGSTTITGTSSVGYPGVVKQNLGVRHSLQQFRNDLPSTLLFHAQKVRFRFLPRGCNHTPPLSNII
jgi:hypothetical protein